MSKHSVIVEIATQDGKRDEVLALWKSVLAEADTANSDITEMVVALDDADDNMMRLIELYGESAGYDRVMQSPEVGSFVERVEPLLSGPPNIIRSTPVWSKGISLD